MRGNEERSQITAEEGETLRRKIVKGMYLKILKKYRRKI